MHLKKGDLTDLLLILSGLFIPINIYAIGNWMGTGVQFALFRVQIATTTWSYISLFRDIEYIFRAIVSAKTGTGILLWTASAMIMAFAVFLYFFQEDIWGSGSDVNRIASRRFIGLSIIGSAVLFLLSIMIQYGPFFHGPSGFAIPVGIPLLLYTGIHFYRGPSDSSPISLEGTAPVPKSWRSQLRNPRMILALFCFVVIFLTLNHILYIYPDAGGDFATYCSAVDLWHHQENPYDAESISLTKLDYRFFGKPVLLPFFYPPATLLFFAPICGALHLVYPFKIYFPMYLVVFVLGCFIANRFPLMEKDRLLMYTLLTSGFASLYWSFSTGNIGILYVLFISLAFYFFMKKRYYSSSLCIAFMSIFNIFPIIFSILYIFSGTSTKEKMKIIAFPVIVLGISLVISYITYPALFESYVNQLVGESSPIYEVEGYMTPTAYLFLQDLTGLFIGRDTAIPYVLDLFFVGIILTALYYFYKKNRNNAVKLFAFGLIAIFLLIPRLKPNYFVLILVPIYLLILEERDMIKTMVLIIGAILPFIGLLIADHMPVENTTRDLFSLVISYNQLICALAVFILIAWLSVRKVAGRESIFSLAPEGKQ